jgi:nucleoside-diphosphate-sugar epimerase
VKLQHLDPASEQSVRELLGAARPDVVFHLSGQARPGRAASDPAGTLEANTRAVWVLLETIRTLTPHTVLVVAATTEQGPDRFGDRHPYFVSKAAAELICASYAATYGVRVAIARLSHVYGPDEDLDRLVTAIVAASVAGGSLQLKDPQRRFDLLFIEDATAGLAAVSDRARAGGPLAYNLSTGASLSGEEVAALVARLVDGDHPAPEQTVPVGARRPAGRPAGWRPEVPLVAGLAATIAWHRSRVGEGLHVGV